MFSQGEVTERGKSDMRNAQRLLVWRIWLSVGLLIALPAGAAEAADFKAYYQFQGGAAGAQPSNVVADSAGNLYATLFSGGAYNAGAIVKLTESDGAWTSTVIHSFCARPLCPDGWAPDRELVIDANGNLYGVTLWGGNQTCQYGCGLVYQMVPVNGTWKYRALYRFTGGGDGCYPQARLELAVNGTLFGTTPACGISNNGTVFELRPSPAVGRIFAVLHAFTNAGDDGSTPYAGVILDKAGNLYGTTGNGGVYHDGTVFELSPSGNGWRARTLYSFSNDRVDGENPYSAVSMDTAGNLYGATYGGGNFNGPICGGGCGIIYKLTPSGVTWNETILHTFSGGADGAFPGGKLVFDEAGNLYGTATEGGNKNCDGGYGCGTVFKLTQANGVWSESTLHYFTGQDDGWAPRELFFDQKGRLNGNAGSGGLYNSGVLFSLEP